MPQPRKKLSEYAQSVLDAHDELEAAEPTRPNPYRTATAATWPEGWYWVRYGKLEPFPARFNADGMWRTIHTDGQSAVLPAPHEVICPVELPDPVKP